MIDEVPHRILNRFGVLPLGDHQSHEGMPQVVKPHPREDMVKIDGTFKKLDHLETGRTRGHDLATLETSR